MFENSGFEIYETSVCLEIERDEEVEKSDRHLLQMREMLDAIKKKYYEIIEYTADWSIEEKTPHIQRWLNWLSKLTGPIRGQAVEEALEGIKDEMAIGGGGGGGGGGGRKRQRDEEKEEDDDE